ncbi:MAG: SPOR domain-containing protein [Myxococcales bacterium]|nr:SPOR domain-containing protein [Myxococcales bacterium]
MQQQTATKKPDATASHFTLQLSAFPDKADAEEFMRKIQSAGYKPFLVASEIPGKGVFYRVRVGDYGSRQVAVDAKAEFERKQRIIAYVAKL